MIKFIVFYLTIILSINLYGQDRHFTVYDTSNSKLPSNYVTDIEISSSGVKWIATYKGLLQINEIGWHVYNSDNTLLPADQITKLALDHYEGLWIGTINGLAHFDLESWSVYNKENSDLLENYISALTVDPLNRVWIGSYNSKTYIDGGLSIYDGNSWITINKDNSDLPDNRILAIRFENEDIAWLGTVNGLVKMLNNSIYVYNHTNSILPTNIISSIDVDENGDKWIAVNARYIPYYVENGGLIKMRNTSMTLLNEVAGLNSRCNSIKTVTIDKLQNIWFGMHTMVDYMYSYGAGLGVYDNVSWNYYLSELPNSTINTIAFNNDNNIWIGTYGGIATDEIISDINSEERDNLNYPRNISLLQNYPNPFNPTTNIEYYLQFPNYVCLKVFDIIGQEIVTLVKEYQYSGRHIVQFEANGLSSGIYIYRLEVNNFSVNKKMVLIQ